MDLPKLLGRASVRLWAAAHDVVIAATAFFGAYVTVFGLGRALQVPGIAEKTIVFTWLSAALFSLFGVFRSSWRYVSLPDFKRIFKASITLTGVYTLGAFLLTRGDNIPRSVPILTALFLIAGLCGTRLAYRLMREEIMSVPRFTTRRADRNVLLCGLSDRAEGFLRASRRDAKNRLRVVGILDDARINHGRIIQDVKVLGALDELGSIVQELKRRNYSIGELIVTETAPGRQRLERILETGTAAGLKVLRIPDATDTAEITSDSLLEPKQIEIGDLLGRPEVSADLDGVAKLINGKVVVVTGAGGSIGSELCRQIATFSPRQLVITDSSEFHLYLLDTELRGKHLKLELVSRIVDVRENQRVSTLFEEFRPNVVFHAAALKHVPLVEDNPVEAIKTNVMGTCHVANAAIAVGVSTMVMISTDKAVNPTNVMGATKRAAEAYCQSLDLSSGTTRLSTVRFGNVLGSNGSVVPRFQEQIANGGPLTVTHPNIVRFFMTIPEAVRLVLNASAHAMTRPATRGRIMVLDMGEPVRILDLAERMIQLAGLRPHTDIEIVYTGLRPGEKLFEELFDPSEAEEERTEEGYLVASPRIIDAAVLRKALQELERAAAREDKHRAIELLSHIVPEYRRATESQSNASSRPSVAQNIVAPAEGETH